MSLSARDTSVEELCRWGKYEREQDFQGREKESAGCWCMRRGKAGGRGAELS